MNIIIEKQHKDIYEKINEIKKIYTNNNRIVNLCLDKYEEYYKKYDDVENAKICLKIAIIISNT